MKKILSLVLMLAMLASLAIVFPFGASAASTPTTVIFEEDFSDVANGTYTAEEFAELVGWTLIRSDEKDLADDPETTEVDETTTPAKVEVADGVAIFYPSERTDLVFLMTTDSRLAAQNVTYQYDMMYTRNHYANTSPTSGANMATGFAAVYTGKDSNVNAVVPKRTYENYFHLTYTTADFNEKNHSALTMIMDQARGESMNVSTNALGERANIMDTFQITIDRNVNAISILMNGALIGSSRSYYKEIGATTMGKAGENAYLRVQHGQHTAANPSPVKFDNISVALGGDAVIHTPTNGVYWEENFDRADATLTQADLLSLFGIYANNTNANDTYYIKDGALHLDINKYAADNTTANKGPVFYKDIPELELENRYTIEWEQTYVFDEAARAAAIAQAEANGETAQQAFKYDGQWDFDYQGVKTQFYGVRSDNSAWIYPTNQGFLQFHFKHDQEKHEFVEVSPGQVRPTLSPWNTYEKTRNYVDKNGTNQSIANSTDYFKLCYDASEGLFAYVNGELVVYGDVKNVNSSVLDSITGSLIRWDVSAGVHVKMDNIKVHTNAFAEEDPELLITEVASNGPNATNGMYEYFEMYNNSTERINVFDYVIGICSDGNATFSYQNQFPARIVEAPNVVYPFTGTKTFTNTVKGKAWSNTETGESGTTYYSVTLTNPAYEEGWVEPGEVFYYWMTTNAMHNGGYSNPSDMAHSSIDATTGVLTNTYNDTYSTEKFRNISGLSEDVKVIKVYNDYNLAIGNSGTVLYGVGAKADFLNADYTLNPAMAGKVWTSAKTDLISYVYFSRHSTANTNMYMEGVASYPWRLYNAALTQVYHYALNNGVKEGRFLKSEIGTNKGTMGTVAATQTRTVTGTVDGASKTYAIGGHEFGTDDTLYLTVGGVAQTAKRVVLAADGFNVQTVGLGLTAKTGASIRFGNNSEQNGIRFETTIDADDLATVLASGLVTVKEMGTILTHTTDMGVDTVLSLEAVNGSTIRKVTAAEFYDGTTFAGSVVNLKSVEREFTAVGYVIVEVDGVEKVLYSVADRTATGLANQTRSIAGVADELQSQADFEDWYASLSEYEQNYFDSLISNTNRY